MQSICVAFKAHMGWINAVAVRQQSNLPTPLLAQRIDLFDGNDREELEPYHVAGGWQGLEHGPRPADPEAVIKRGRRKQTSATKLKLKAFRATLTQSDLQWGRAVVLVGRGYLGNLEHTLGSHAHIHVAEGEAIRDATRTALDTLQIEHINQDEKSVLSLAAEKLDCTTAECDELMKTCRPGGVKSWTKEERLIALCAWLHGPYHSGD